MITEVTDSSGIVSRALHDDFLSTPVTTVRSLIYCCISRIHDYLPVRVITALSIIKKISPSIEHGIQPNRCRWYDVVVVDVVTFHP